MLELATIFLLTFVMSLTIIWLYRSLSGWKGFGENLTRDLDQADGMKIARQSGFINMFSAPKEKARNIRLRNTNKNIKAPWGW
jgi:hypothetical protein